MRRFRPAPELARRVLSIDIIDDAPSEAFVLPGTAVVLGLQYRGRVLAEHGELTHAGVTGLQNRARTYRYRDRTASVLVRFTAQGAACLGVPVSELTGRNVSLDDLLPAAEVNCTIERLAEASDPRARVSALEDLLANLPWHVDPLVETAVLGVEASIEQHADGPLVRALSKRLGVSERTLERRFLRQVGVSPRRFASLLRFERAVAGVRRGERLTDLALEAGYYDQAHFNREFRRFVGQAPTQFLRQG